MFCLVLVKNKTSKKVERHVACDCIGRYLPSIVLPYADYTGVTDNNMYNNYGADGDTFTFTGEALPVAHMRNITCCTIQNSNNAITNMSTERNVQ